MSVRKGVTLPLVFGRLYRFRVLSVAFLQRGIRTPGVQEFHDITPQWSGISKKNHKAPLNYW